MKSETKEAAKEVIKNGFPLEDGTAYSRRKGFQPFSASPVEDYIPIVGEERIEELRKLAAKLNGARILEVNSTAVGGGVAEMLYSQVPFLNQLGLEDEWKVMSGTESFYQVTKTIYNLLQGKKGTLTPEMTKIYYSVLEENAAIYAEDYENYNPDISVVHDPQPLGLARYLKRGNKKWLWRSHFDVEEDIMENNRGLWQFITFWANFYDAVIFSGAHYVIGCWPLQKYIIPPFIDPLSLKNKKLGVEEIAKVLEKYGIDQSVPLLVQVGRFDPWKGIDTSIRAYKMVKKEMNCQLVIAGGMASDDPEGATILDQTREEAKGDPDIHVIRLPEDVQVSALEVNALQRAARVILQPSIREGFGLVITEAMWKAKPVITREVGAIPIQVRGGETGLFITSAKKAAKKIVRLLKNPREAESIGEKAHTYVKNHFLMPDRVADYLRVANYFINGELDRNSITSYHPWFKLSKRSG